MTWIDYPSEYPITRLRQHLLRQHLFLLHLYRLGIHFYRCPNDRPFERVKRKKNSYACWEIKTGIPARHYPPSENWENNSGSTTPLFRGCSSDSFRKDGHGSIPTVVFSRHMQVRRPQRVFPLWSSAVRYSIGAASIRRSLKGCRKTAPHAAAPFSFFHPTSWSAMHPPKCRQPLLHGRFKQQNCRGLPLQYLGSAPDSCLITSGRKN